MPHRWIRGGLERRLPENVNVTPDRNVEFQWPSENPFTSFTKAWGDTVIEAASEEAGAGLRKGGKWLLARGAEPLKRLPFGQKMVDALFAGWQKLHPKGKWADFIRQISTKLGYHGLVEEIGEEFLGDQLRALTNVEDFGTEPGASVFEKLGAAFEKDVQQLPEMAVAFSIPGVGRQAIARLGGPQTTAPIEEKESLPDDWEALEVAAKKEVKPKALENYQLWAEDNQLSAEEYADGLKELIRTEPKNWDRAQYVRGHHIPKQLGWTEEKRRDFMKELTGKDSMKKMSHEEKAAYIEALYDEAEKAGIDFTTPKSLSEELITTLELTMKKDVPSPIEKLNRSHVKEMGTTIKRGWSRYWLGLERLERFCERVDGFKDGPFYNTFARPLKEQSTESTKRRAMRWEELTNFLDNKDIDPAAWYGTITSYKLQNGKTTKLTAAERIGIYLHNQNKDGLRHIKAGYELTDTDIKNIIDSMSDKELTTVNWMSEQYELQWPILENTAIQAGMKQGELKKVYHYAPLIIKGDAPEQQKNLINDLLDSTKNFKGQLEPEKGMLEKRVPGAKQPVELDAFAMYTHSINNTEHFIAMAPLAMKLDSIMRNKAFRKTLNDSTNGHGVRIFQNWVGNTVRGKILRGSRWMDKMVRILNRQGIVFAIGWNLPSMARQTLSGWNAAAVDPKMWRFIPGNMLQAATPKNFKEMQRFALEKSKVLPGREFDRDLKSLWNRKILKKRLAGKKPLSEHALALIRWMDKRTTVTAWKSLYDTAVSKGMNEEEAIKYADKWISRTQPMAKPEDLPDFFAGGTIERILTVFQNQINQNLNFWKHDILEARKAEVISNTEVGYRVMFSYVFPAMLFGMVGRARPPEDFKEILIDLVTYPMASFLIVGRWINRTIRGWGNSQSLIETGPEGFIRTIESAKKGDWSGILRNGARAVGGPLGFPTAQMVRTFEGGYDLAVGNTSDPRRLIWSKWALQQGQKEGIKRQVTRQKTKRKVVKR